jgi:hypothetical protein
VTASKGDGLRAVLDHCEWCAAPAKVRVTVEPARFGMVKDGLGQSRKALVQTEIVVMACAACAQRVKRPALTPPKPRDRREGGQLDIFDALGGVA